MKSFRILALLLLSSCAQAKDTMLVSEPLSSQVCGRTFQFDKRNLRSFDKINEVEDFSVYHVVLTYGEFKVYEGNHVNEECGDNWKTSRWDLQYQSTAKGLVMKTGENWPRFIHVFALSQGSEDQLRVFVIDHIKRITPETVCEAGPA